jgi:hypothetical protein
LLAIFENPSVWMVYGWYSDDTQDELFNNVTAGDHLACADAPEWM